MQARAHPKLKRLSEVRRQLLSVAPVLFLALVCAIAVLAVAAWRRTAAVNEYLRKTLVSQLTRTLGTEVRVDRLSGNPLTGLTFRGVFVGSKEQSPIGAFAKVDAIRVRYHGSKVLFHHADPLTSIRAIEVVRPQLYLHRDRSRVWNYQKFLPRRKRKPFDVRLPCPIRVVDAAVYLLDDFWRSREGRSFRHRFTGIGADVYLCGRDPIRYHALTRDKEGTFSRAESVGSIRPDKRGATFDIQFLGARMPYWGSYLFRSFAVDVTGGRADGRVELRYESVGGGRSRLFFRGAAQVLDGALVSKALPRRLEQLSGEVSFVNRTVEFSGLSFKFGGTKATATGAAVLESDPAFDADIASESLDLNDLFDMVGKEWKAVRRYRAQGLGGTRARVAGRLSDFAVVGTVRFPPGRLRIKGFGAAKLAPFAFAGTLWDTRRSPHLEGAFSVPSLQPVPVSGEAPLLFLRDDGIATGRVVGLRLRVWGVPEDPTVEAAFRLAKVKVREVAARNLRTIVRYHNGRVRMEFARAEVGGGELVAAGDINLSREEARYALTGRVQQLDLAAMDPWLNRHGLALQGVASGKVAVAGANDKGRVDFEVSAPEVAMYRPVEGASGTFARESSVKEAKATGWAEFAPGVEAQQVRAASEVEGKTLEVARGGSDPQSQAQWSVEAPQATLSLADGKLTVHRSRGRLLGGALSVAGTADLYSHEVKATFSAADLKLADLAKELDKKDWQGSLSVQGEVTGTAEHTSLQGHSEILEASFGPWPIAFATTAWKWDSHTLLFERATVRSLGGRYVGRGELARIDLPKGDAQVEADVEASGIHLAEVLRVAGSKAAVDAIVSGKAHVSGSLLAPKANFSATAQGGQALDVTMDQGVLQASFADRKLSVSRAAIRVEEGGFLAYGSIDLDKGMDLTVEGERVPLDSALKAAGFDAPVDGVVSGKGKVTGKLDAPRIVAQVETSDVGLRQQEVGRFQGVVHLAGSVLEARPLTALGRAGRLEVTGKIPLRPLSADEPRYLLVELKRGDVPNLLSLLTEVSRSVRYRGDPFPDLQRAADQVGSLPKPLAGRLSARSLTTGKGDKPVTEVDLQLEAASLRNEPLPRTEATATIENRRVTVKRFTARSGDALLEVKRGSYWDAGSEKLSLESDFYNFDLKTLKTWTGSSADVSGVANVSVVAQGDAKSPTVKASAEVSALSFSGLQFDRLRAAIILYRDGNLVVNPGDLILTRQDHRFQLWGKLPVQFQPLRLPPDRSLDVHFSAHDENLSVLPFYLSAVSEASGSLEAEAGLSGTSAAPRLSGQVEVHDGLLLLRGLKRPVTSLSLDLRMTPETNEIQVAKAVGAIGQGRISASGKIALPQNGWKDFSRSRFQLHASAENVPGYEGDWLRVTGLTGALSLTTGESGKQVVTVEHLSASDGKAGRIMASGSVVLPPDLRQRPEKWKANQFDLRAEVSDFSFGKKGVMSGKVTSGQLKSASGEPGGESSPMRVKGLLRIGDTTVTGFPKRETFVPMSVAKWPSYPVLDLGVTIGDRVWVRNPRVRAPVRGSLVVSGVPNDPTITGELRAEEGRGRLRFPGAQARLASARVVPTVTTDPATGNLVVALDVGARAEARVQRHELSIIVSNPLTKEGKKAPLILGQPDQKLEMEVQATPPLADNQAWARLAGLDPQVDLATPGAAREAVLQQLYGLFRATPLFAGLEGTLADLLRLEEFGIDYRFNEPVNVRVGKEISDRVFVTYSRSLRGQLSAESWRFEYRIGPRLLLGFETGTVDRPTNQVFLEKTFSF